MGMNRIPLRSAGVLSCLLLALLLPPAAAQPAPGPGPDAEAQRHTSLVTRVAGDSRVATAIAASRHAFPDGASTVVLAAARRFPDALAAVPLAAREGAPLLLVEERAHGAVLEEVKRLGAERAILIAAHGAIPVVVELELERAGLQVERLAGEGRFHTAARVARRLGPGPDGEVLVASGVTFADALPAGPLAALAGLPVVLTGAEDIPADTAAVLGDLGATRSLLVGGRAVVSDTVAAGLPQATRLSGRDRYRTSVELAEELLARGGTLQAVGVATGRDFADALAAGPAVAADRGPVLLVDGQDPDNAAAVYAFLAEHRAEIGRVLLFGGTSAISEAVRQKVVDALRGGA